MSVIKDKLTGEFFWTKPVHLAHGVTKIKYQAAMCPNGPWFWTIACAKAYAKLGEQ